FDAETVESAVREAFASWKRGTPPTTVPPRPSMKRALHMVNRAGAVQSSIYMGLPVVHPAHPDSMKLAVTNALLGGSFSSRITTNIREQKGYTYSPYSLVTSHYKDAYWAQVADVTTNVTGPSLKEIFHEIDKLQAEPPSEEELKAIKAYLVGTFTLQVSSREGLAARLRFQRLHELPGDYLETYVQRVMAVTTEDVQRMARQYLLDEKMTVVVVGDRKAVEPQLKPFGPVIVAPAL
ncbi:MAG: insulinase family protein, partial [Myxococcaceae bacterium]|nr:insulinase family protein [Myxococcaceae bacterium]